MDPVKEEEIQTLLANNPFSLDQSFPAERPTKERNRRAERAQTRMPGREGSLSTRTPSRSVPERGPIRWKQTLVDSYC
jgi:hypothetical protein